MKVCLVAYKFYESVPRMSQFASAFVGRGDEVDVIALRREGQSAFEVVDGVRLHRVQMRVVDEPTPFSHAVKMLRFMFQAALTITKRHLIQNYDAIHIFSVPDCLVFSAIIPKLMGASVILDIYDIVPEFYAAKYPISRNSMLFRMLLLMERRSISFCHHVTISNRLWFKTITSRSAQSAKCTTIDTIPSSQLFYPRPKQRTDGKFVIIYPGTFNWHQGVDIAIKAFARISNNIPEAEFHIYGEGPSKSDLKKLVENLGLQEKIKFYDLLPSRSIVHCMANSDLAIVPKRASSEFGNEAASTKIPELMALGVPVIASRTKIDSEYYTDSLVKFFASENVEDLANSILLLYQNAELRNQLVDNGAKYVQASNWDTKKQRYLALVDSLVLRRFTPSLVPNNAETHFVE